MADLERIRKAAYEIEQEARKGDLKDIKEAIKILAECIARITDIIHGMLVQMGRE
jgi:hypothetical protein